jgi:hypothetical protein
MESVELQFTSTFKTDAVALSLESSHSSARGVLAGLGDGRILDVTQTGDGELILVAESYAGSLPACVMSHGPRRLSLSSSLAIIGDDSLTILPLETNGTPNSVSVSLRSTAEDLERILLIYEDRLEVASFATRTTFSWQGLRLDESVCYVRKLCGNHILVVSHRPPVAGSSDEDSLDSYGAQPYVRIFDENLRLVTVYDELPSCAIVNACQVLPDVETPYAANVILSGDMTALLTKKGTRLPESRFGLLVLLKVINGKITASHSHPLLGPSYALSAVPTGFSEPVFSVGIQGRVSIGGFRC